MKKFQKLILWSSCFYNFLVLPENSDAGSFTQIIFFIFGLKGSSERSFLFLNSISPSHKFPSQISFLFGQDNNVKSF